MIALHRAAERSTEYCILPQLSLTLYHIVRILRFGAGLSLEHPCGTPARDARIVNAVTGSPVQGPLSRFGDTAANSGTLAVLDSYESTSTLPVAVKTLAASTASAGFRIVRPPPTGSWF